MTLAESRLRTPTDLVDRLRADIEFLASPELEGRGTPSRGLDVAAVYLESRLRAIGARPVAGSAYRQVYRLGQYSPAQARVEVRIGGNTLSPDDYVFWNISRDPDCSSFRLPLVNVGDGVAAPEKGIDRFHGVDVGGAAAVATKGAPWALDPEKLFGPDRALGKTLATTVRGGRLLVYVSEGLDEGGDEESRFLEQMKNAPVSFLREEGVGHASALSPVLTVRPSALDRAMGRTLQDAPEGPLGVELEIRIDASVEEAQASNVVAVLEGTDPSLADEHLLLSAHYDHLGVSEVDGEQKIWPGADDNASGVAGVLEIARRLASRPRKRPTLIFFGSGEERAILGSAFYNSRPLIPLDRIGVQLNVDMIGRSDGTIQGIADGSPELFETASAHAQTRGIEMAPDRQPECRLVYLTDTYHFARAGTPFLFYFTGLHDDYHQPTDTPDKIRYSEMTRIVEGAADLAEAFADGAPLPRFERPDWFITPPE